MAPYEIWPFQPALFLADTRDLTTPQVGAYIKLLGFYWLNRRLPAADRELARIVGWQGAVWTQNREALARLFYNVGEPGGWKHRRTERDLAAARAYHELRRA